MSHLCIRATVKLITQQFVQPSITTDIWDWAIKVVYSASVKIGRHTRFPIVVFSIPDACFTNIHIDLVGSLLQSRGYEYILIAFDCYTHWLAAYLINDTSTGRVIAIFLDRWISQFGV